MKCDGKSGQQIEDSNAWKQYNKQQQKYNRYMSKLLQQRDQMVYPPQVATQDSTNWAYVHSFLQQPFTQSDLDAPNYTQSQSNKPIGDRQRAEGGANQGQQKQNGGKKEAIDRFSSLVDTEAPRFFKQRKETYKQWEQNVQGVCSSMHRSIEAFYDRKINVHNDIVHSTISKRDAYWPQADLSEITDEIKQLAVSPWIFQTLPGTKPQIQWPSSLESLVERLDTLEPCSLWNEPLDILCGGPEFFSQASTFIREQAAALAVKQDSQQLVRDLSLALTCHFGVAVQSGNHQHIIESLDLQIELSQELSNQQQEQIFAEMKPRATKYVNQMIEVLEKRQEQRVHHLQGSSVHGTISIAKYISTVNLSEFTSSLTIDDEGYLYLWISIPNRGTMYKIGTGENGTVPGKVYLSQPYPEKEGEVTWVYCQGKLYARRINEAGTDIGHLLIYDPQTLTLEGTAKINVSPPEDNSSVSDPTVMKQQSLTLALNRQYPLLTDGRNLYAITMNYSVKRRRVKDSLRKQYAEFQEEKKKRASEPAPAKIESPVTQAQNAKDEVRKRRNDDREKKLLEEMARIKDSEDKGAQERLQKELNRQKMREQKQEMERKAKELQRLKEKGGAPPGEESAPAKPQPLNDIEHYRVCEFYLHEFDLQHTTDTQAQSSKAMPSVEELLAQPIVVEMFESFSGFFTFEECYRSLKSCNNDIAEAANWLVDEGERERGKKELSKKKTLLLCESEVVNIPMCVAAEQAPGGARRPYELDISVKEGSILPPFAINAGKWTISAPPLPGQKEGQYVSFHNLSTDNGSIRVFSLSQKDYKVQNDELAKTSSLGWEDSIKNEEDVKEEKPREESPEAEVVIHSERDFYEAIKLKGTFVKTIKLPRSGSIADLSGYNSYVVYDHSYKKFYIMMLGAQSRFIAVAEDLGELYQLLKDPKMTWSGNHSQRGDPSSGDSDLTALSAFALKALESLNELGKARFNMPWRWRPWSNNYQQFLQQWSMEQFELAGAQNSEESGRRAIEQRKKKITKLQTRLDKVLLIEKQEERDSIGIPYDEKMAKQVQAKMSDKAKAQAAAQVAQIKDQIKEAPRPATRKAEPVNVAQKLAAMAQPKLKRQIAEDEMQLQRHPEESVWGAPKQGGLFDSPPQAIFGQKKPQVEKSSEQVLPKEKIILYKESQKLYAFCVNGTLQTLQILVKNMKKGNVTLNKAILKQLIQWVTYADYLIQSTRDGVNLLNELRVFLIDSIKEEASQPQVDKEILSLLWKVLILGWPILVRTTEQSFEVLTLIIQQSCSEIYQKPSNITVMQPTVVMDPNTGKLSEEKKRVKLPAINYYTKIFINQLSPIELFQKRFFNYHGSYFPIEILQQTRVNPHIVLIERGLFAESDAFNHYDQQRQEQDDTAESFYSRFQRFRNVHEPFQHYRQLPEVSLSLCKTYITKSVDVGSQINHNFFNTPCYLTFIGNHDSIEDLEHSFQSRNGNNIDLDQVRALYTESPFEASSLIHLSPKELHEQKLKELYLKRQQHAEHSKNLIELFKVQIKNSLNEVSSELVCWDNKVSSALMRTFNELVRQSLALIDWTRTEHSEIAVGYIRFIEEALSILAKKTNNFKVSPLKTHQVHWFNYIKDLLTIVLHEIYGNGDTQTFTYLSKRAIEPLTSIIETIKLFFMFTKEETIAATEEGAPPKVKHVDECFLDHMIGFMQEGTDFSIEKVFETPHPYPKGEYIQKDTISMSKAVGYTIELDKRCMTELNSDSLTISSADHVFWINDTFGTHIKITGRQNFNKLPFMIFGSKMNIEFRSTQHRGHPPPGRGGRGGYAQSRSIREDNLEGDSSLRWGFRVIIRPIYCEPHYVYKHSVKRENFNEVTQKLGVENTFGLVSLLNQLAFMTSKMTRNLIEAGGNNLSIEQDRAKLSSHDQIFSSRFTQPSHHSIFEAEVLQKFVHWHLFKGGVRTETIDQLHNPKVLEETLKQIDSSRDQGFKDLIQGLESFKDTVSTQEEGLRKRRTSISNLIKDAEKIDSQSHEFVPNESSYTNEVRTILSKMHEEDSLMHKVFSRVRQLVPYQMSFLNERRRPSFKADYQKEWERVEQLLILSMLYHSNSLEETKLYFSSTKDQPLADRVEERLKLMGAQLNDLLAWMISRLQGEQEFKNLLLEIVDKSQQHINSLVERKKAEEIEKARKKAEQEEIKRVKDLEKARIAEEENAKLQAQAAEEAKKNAKMVKAPVVTKEKVVHKSKRKNVIKMTSQAMKDADLLKLKKGAKSKKAADEEAKKKVPGEEIKAADGKTEEKSEDPMKKEIVEEKKEIKFLELTPNEERDAKQKIYMQVYEEQMQRYQGNLDLVKPICTLLNIMLNPEDPNESIKAIFKRAKARLRSLIDFDGDLPLREALDIDELKLESPYKEISKDVKARLQFLLELKPSVDYHSKVIQVDFNHINKRLQRMQTSGAAAVGATSQTSQDDDKSSQHIYTESSIHDGDDSEILEPLGIQRSQSVQVGLQPSLNGISGVSQAIIAQQSKMKEDEIVNWIDNYRKWRQWNRQHKMMKQGGASGLDHFDEDLTSPYCSPMYAVVSFAKASKLLNPDSLRKAFINHQVKAAVRSIGLKYQESLLKCLSSTPYQRLILSNISHTLVESTFNQIETCGETLAQTVNETSRLLVRQLMLIVLQGQKVIDRTIYLKTHPSAAVASSNAAADSNSAAPKQPAQPPQNAPAPALDKAALQAKQSQMKSAQIRVEMSDHQHLKHLLQSLNDIRVVLNDIYSREYVLESLRRGQVGLLKDSLRMTKSIDEDKLLTFDIVKDFLRAIVELMLQFNTGSSQFIGKQSQYSSSKMQFAIAYSCKLILNLFMTDKSMMRSAETHRLLQESLLDIVVDKLEKLCGLKKKETADGEKSSSRPPGYKLNKITHQDEVVQLMKLLSEVIRISNDHQQHMKSMQQMSANLEAQKQILSAQVSEGFFLSEGSEKVMRCAQILAFMMHNVEVPIVMRQTIKCAKLFFKLVDFTKLHLYSSTVIEDSMLKDKNQFLIETLRQIGSKISNTQQDNIATKKKEEEKQYVVYANINSTEEDYSFLVTALYHWESLHPTFTLDLPKDPAEIVVKPAAPKQEEEKKAEEAKQAPVAGAQPGGNAAQMIQQIVEQQQDSNVDLQELIRLQQQELNRVGRGAPPGRGGFAAFEGRGGFRGRGGAPVGGRGDPLPYQKLPSAVDRGFARQPQLGKPSGDNTKLFQPGQNIQMSAGQMQNIGIVKLDAIFDELIKQTWEDAKAEDSNEEKMRKLNEKNFNSRVQTHIKDAVAMSCYLYSRYTSPLSEPLPLLRALEFSNLLQRAYNGELEPIGINPYLKAESKDKKLSDSKTVAQHFPLLVSTIEVSKAKKELPPGHGPPIVIAPKKLVVSLAEASVAIKYEQTLETKLPSLKNLEKNPIEGFKCNVLPQSIRRQGASISVIIQEFITLIRSLINTTKLAPPTFSKQPSHTPTLSQQESSESISYTRQQSLLKIQKSEEQASNELVEVINQVIDELAEKKWNELSETYKQVVFGTLAVVAGWTPPIRTGQPVQVEINNIWVDATIVDDGLGKKRISVLLDDDDTLQIQKIPIERVRPLQRLEWPFEGPLSDQIDQERVCAAIIHVYNQVKSQEHSLAQSSILSEPYLLMMLLKMSSQLKWNFMDKENNTFKSFMSILNDITSGQTSSEEDKTRTYWEKSLVDSWERLLDKQESNNFDFFVIKENLVPEITSPQESSLIDNPVIEDSKPIGESIDTSSNPKQQGKLKHELQSNYQDSEFVQPLSSYLQGLPEIIPKKNQSDASLKLLAYWEKNVIPRILEFVRTTYRPIEMEYSMEQLRSHLRKGDSGSALRDALIMFENKIPQGCIIPDDNYDWTCKMIDECVVDSWALAKFKPQRSQRAGSIGQGNQQSAIAQQGDTSFPLLNKLINLGIDEIVVLIKAVDFRGNVVLAEYQDPDTMQIHSIWIPVSHLSDLHNPQPPRAVGYSTKTLKREFNDSVQRIKTIYARQTLIQFFHAFQNMNNNKSGIFQLPSNQIQLPDLMSWSVWEQFSSSPINGWMKELPMAIPVKTQPAANADLSVTNSSSLQELVKESSEKIAFENLLKNVNSERGSSKSQSLELVMKLFEKTIASIDEKSNPDYMNSEDVKIVKGMIDWCIMNWFNISERIRSDRAVFDICAMYEQYNRAQPQSSGSSSASDQQTFAQTNLLPLHELIQKQAGTVGSGSTSAIGTLIIFKQKAAQLVPTSKIQFYSDPNKVNLISEINAGLEGITDVPPLLINHGQIWVHIDQGTTALLPKYKQSDQKSSLPCAVVQIPNTWTVCCWFTEAITNALLLNVEKSTNFTVSIFEQLISALTTFYEEAKAPSILKSIVFNLLSRLIIKLRHVYNCQYTSDSLHDETARKEFLKKHLDRYFMKKDFLLTLLSELLVHKDMEEHGQQLQKQQGSILYSAFIQDSVELLLSLMMPAVQNITLKSYKDLLQDIEVPEWAQPLIKALYFMQYFSGEMKLSEDILKEIHSETKPEISQLEQIMIIQGVPKNFSKEELLPEIIKVVTKHGVRILQPARDITFDEDQIAIIVDGVDHMALSKDPEDDLTKDEFDGASDQEEDAEGESEEVKLKKQKAAEKKKLEEAMPVIYNCLGCTFENPISSSVCSICDTPRPPMEVIIADFRAANAALFEPKPSEETKSDQPQVKKKTLTQIRLDSLAGELTRLVSRLQRKTYKLKLQEFKEEQEKKQKPQEEVKASSEEVKAPKVEEIKEPVLVSRIVRSLHSESPRSHQSGRSSSYRDVDEDENSAEGSFIDDHGHSHRQAPRRGGNDPERQKFLDLGIDAEIIDNDIDLARVLAESMLADQEANREREEQKKREEDEKRKKEKEEQDRLKQIEEEKKLAELAAASGLQMVVKPQYLKLKVLVGADNVFNDINSSRFIFKILRARVAPTDPSSEAQFNPDMLGVLKDIHEQIVNHSKDDISPFPSSSSPLLEDFGITFEAIKEGTLEELVMKCSMLAEADMKEFVKFIESQGFDIWMERAFFGSHQIPERANKLITINLLEKLKSFIEIQLCKESKGIVSLHPSTLRLPQKVHIDITELAPIDRPINYYDDTLIGANYPELQESIVTQADLRYQWALLRIFNQYLAPTVPFINTTQSGGGESLSSSCIPMRLSAYMSATRNLCLLNVKFDLRHLILEKTSVQREQPPKLYFERLKLAANNKDNNSGDNNEISSEIIQANQQSTDSKNLKRQTEFMFIQAYEQIKDMDLAQLRPKKPMGADPHLSFSIVFRGEHVVGEGGPYRQFFADVSSELQPLGTAIKGSEQKLLGLLCKSPNNKSVSNVGRGKFVINASRSSSHDLSYFEFLGILMGICIRTGAHLNLDLPQFVWKQLTGQRIGPEDLIEIDIGFWQQLSFMVTANKKMFEESIFETWSVLLSDLETTVDLKENGREIPVLYEDRFDYIRLALNTRLTECAAQCQAIKRGIAKVIPEALLNMATYNELETWVCGKAIVDIELLKRHTRFGGGDRANASHQLNEDSPLIKWFWEVLISFTEEEKQKFIKFCWGQQRLPANDEEFERRQTRFMIKPAMNTKHGDGALPKADTCFFNFELPNYSSKEIMKQRILLAINTDCDSMNAEDQQMHANDGGGRGDRHHPVNDDYDDEY